MAESTVNTDQGKHNNQAKKQQMQLKFNTHRPLHATKSSPAFHSTDTLDIQRCELEGSRSRSASAPLSVEAVTVARELRKVSDIFVQAKRGVARKRRRTLGSILSPSIEKEVAQALKECDENPEKSLEDLGTFV